MSQPTGSTGTETGPVPHRADAHSSELTYAERASAAAEAAAQVMATLESRR